MNYRLMEERNMKKNILILLLMKIAFVGVIHLQSAEMDPMGILFGAEDAIGDIESLYDNVYSPSFLLDMFADLERLNPEPAVSVNSPIASVDEPAKMMPAKSSAKKFKCGARGIDFAQTYNLTRHLKTHTGYKPYACKSCNRRFIKSNGLKSHEKTHDLEKPLIADKEERDYACQSCDKKFINSSNLKLHKRMKHQFEKLGFQADKNNDDDNCDDK